MRERGVISLQLSLLVTNSIHQGSFESIRRIFPGIPLGRFESSCGHRSPIIIAQIQDVHESICKAVHVIDVDNKSI